MPSSPSPLSPHGAPHPHEVDITPHAPAPECPICLEGPSSPPNQLDAFFPCCAAFAHLGCIQQCAHRHGQCPNCRHSIAYLRHDRAFLARCEDAGVRMPLLAADGAETVYAAVSNYAVRTFSRADAPEPEEPHHVRASCCARLAGPAMGFVELPDRSMRWSPVPLRGHAGIRSWTPAWICMRCQAELPAASVSMPLPRPPCHCCHALMIWEVDLRLETERWVCNRCPASGPARPLDLRPFLAASPVQSPTADPVSVAPAAPAVPATPSPPALAEAGAVTPSPNRPQRSHLSRMCRTAITPALRLWITRAQGLHTSRSIRLLTPVSTCRCSSMRPACSTQKHARSGGRTRLSPHGGTGPSLPF